MNRERFMAALREKLAGLPEEDIVSSLEYYGEMIDDRIEDGVPEETAVAAVGSVDEIAEQILMDTPLTKLVKARVKSKRSLKAWEIVLLVLGSPIWLSLLIAAAAVVLSVYITLWAIIISLFAVVLSLAVGAVAALVGIFLAFSGGWQYIVLGIGAALVLAGLAILLYFGAVELAKLLVKLGAAIGLGIKRCFVGKKEDKNNE